MNLDYVKKRDGKKVEFKSEKIVNAVGKAAAAVDQADPEIAAEITAEVLSYLKIFFKNGGTVEVEQIQDLVEKVLIEKGYAEIAKAYILYREQHSKLRDSKKLFADAVNIMDDYLDRSDWKVNENSNMSYSLQGLNNYIASEVTGQYWLQEIYPKETAELHSGGDLHIHDLGNLSVYCCGWDLEELLRSGFRGVPTKIESAPPKHLKTALGQIVNFFYTLQGESAGAQAFSNFDTYLAPFIAYDGLNYEEVKQAMQEFLFNMNVPTRVGFQTPFTNITMDLEVPSYLEDQAVIIGGHYQEKCYGEFQEEMDMLNRAFAELMMEGDAKGRMFSFPIPTYNITEDFEWENEKLDPVWQMTAKFGIPYFCLSENTFIITDKGSKQLKNININKDKVLGDDGNFYRIINLFKNEHKEYIKIITEKQQKIECSKNHKFPTDNGLKKAENLSLNDRLQEYGKQIVFENGFILSYENHHLFDIIDKSGEKIRFEKITKNKIDDFYCLRIRNRERKKIDKFNYEPNRFQTTLKDIRIPQKLDKEIFEMIGQLLGDGYLSKTKNSIRLTSNDSEIIDFFVKTINNKFDLDSSISKAGNSETCLDVTVNSKILKEFLKHIGLKFGRGDEKEIPQIIYKRNEEEIGALLRGLFDTDGSISINNSGNPIITLTLKNRKLLQQVLELLMFLGIAAYYKTSRKKYGEIRIHGEKNIKIFKDKIGFSITRKACRLIAKDSNKPNLGDKIITKKQSLNEFGKDFRQYKEKDIFRVKKDTDGIYLFVNKIKETNNYVEIKSLTNIKKEISTVDIHVNSENHLFTLKNNVVVHNSNFINSDMDPEDARSMCCRLRLDNKELRKRGGGLFGANPLTGSIGVVTLNMPRIGYQAQDKEEFMQQVYYLMDQAKESLEVKRKVLETLTEQGLYPYAKFYLRDIKKRFDQYWKNHFNTIGLNGMNEALLNFMGKDISTPEGQQFSEQVMGKMRERLQQYQEETDNMYNLEATPAEGTAYRFARLDREKFGDQIIAANQERVVKEDADPYYTNSTQLPVGLTDDIFTALELQDELQSLYTGGCIEKGNKVLTNKGAIRIEEIVRDYENLKPIKALSYNAKEDRSEWDLITDAMSIDVSKNNKIRVIAEKGLDITTSDWHPFFVLEKISVKDKCPVCGEKVKGTKSFSTHTRYNPCLLYTSDAADE